MTKQAAPIANRTPIAVFARRAPVLIDARLVVGGHR
jgi:hypothetical protein